MTSLTVTSANFKQPVDERQWLPTTIKHEQEEQEEEEEMTNKSYWTKRRLPTKKAALRSQWQTFFYRPYNGGFAHRPLITSNVRLLM